MICVAIIESSLDDLLTELQNVTFAEVRLEQLKPSLEEVQTIFSLPKKLIATMRPGTVSDEERSRVLVAAVEAGAAYVDVEIESPKWFKDKVIKATRNTKCQAIVSFHDFDSTPEKERLQEIVATCFADGADVAKVACQAHTARDSARILALLDSDRPVIALGMGAAGKITRIAAPLLGAPLTFASRSPGQETAEGQLDIASLSKLFETIQDS
jgi:3-dehydroquinate dehydratase-1